MDTESTCSNDCSTDSDCPERTSCCPSTCGRICATPEYIPYHSPSLVCPDVTGEGVAGICSEECGDGCSEESGELCCSNGCGHACTQGVVPSPLCPHLRDSINNMSMTGAYAPHCEEDGSFSVLQCHSSTAYCWCVATDTGVPVSSAVQFREPQCSESYYEL